MAQAVVKINGEPDEATFLERSSRFSALVKCHDREESAYLPNAGRLKELLLPGRPVSLVKRCSPCRKTGHDLISVALDSIEVPIFL